MTREGKLYVRELYPVEWLTDTGGAVHHTEDEADLTEDDSEAEVEDDRDLSFFAESDMAELEVSLENAAFSRHSQSPSTGLTSSSSPKRRVRNSLANYWV